MTSLLPPRWRNKGNAHLRELVETLRTKQRLALMPTTRVGIERDIADVETELEWRRTDAKVLL